MTFWRKKPAASAEAGEATEGAKAPGRKGARAHRPAGPPVKGTKVRLFLHPPDGIDRLLEVDVPDDDHEGSVTLRCFEPPPERGGGSPDVRSRAWAVDLSEGDVAVLKEKAGAIRLVPLGGRSALGDGSTVELILSSGPAEARLKWWMAPPAGWAPAAELVDLLRALSGEGG